MCLSVFVCVRDMCLCRGVSKCVCVWEGCVCLCFCGESVFV